MLAEDSRGLRAQFLHVDRANPSTLVVNGNGQRYYNEATPYTEFTDAMYAETLHRNSSFAESGVDEDFGKGSSVYSHYYGDPTLKNPNLEPIDRAPFYAVAVYPVGTKGGLSIDEHSRVLSTEGLPIAGLYAAGNSAGSVMGDTYPGAGSSIGAAMVNAYSAVQNLIGEGR